MHRLQSVSSFGSAARVYFRFLTFVTVILDANWAWGWTYQGVNFNNCGIGFDINEGGINSAHQTVGSEVIVDGNIVNTPIFIQTTNVKPFHAFQPTATDSSRHISSHSMALLREAYCTS